MKGSKIMNTLKQLTKKQKADYMRNNNFYYNKKHGYEDAFIAYLFENNTRDDIIDWFTSKASTVSFKGADLISVYSYNKIFNKLLMDAID